MSFRPPGPARPPGRPALAQVRWPRLVLPVIACLIGFIVLVAIVAGIWTDWLWFSAVHYTSVFGTTYGTRWAMFFIAGLFMALITGANAVLAYRLRPIYRPVPTPAGDSGAAGDSYRLAIDPHRRLLLGVLLAVIGVISGVAAAGSWRTWLLFINQVPFHVRDPQFHLDLSFFVFTYPFIRLVLSYLFWAVLLSLVLAVLVHYLYGGLRMQGRRPRVTVATQAHLFVLFGSFVLLKAIAYWVDRYGIDFSQRGAVTTGASYTDVNAVLPAKTVLAVIAVICALLFFAGAARRSAMLPAVGFGLLVLSAILIGGLYPAIIQQFVVKPNELAKETPYIQREIDSTRQAYGITSATVSVHAVPGHRRHLELVPAGQRGQRAAGNAAARPGRGVPDVPAAAADQELLPVPQQPGHGPVPAARRWLAAAGHRGRGARHGRPAARPGQLDQQPPGLHARLRRRRGHRQHRAERRQPVVRGEPDPTHRAAHAAPAPGVLRPAAEHLRDRRRPGRRAPGGTRLPVGRRPAEQHLPRRWRGQRRLAAEPAALRDQVPRAEHPAVRGDQQRLEDPLRPAAAGPGGQGRAVPHPGRRELPGSGQRADLLGGGRVHHHRPVPLLAAGQPGPGHLDQRRARRLGGRAADRPAQLHPQLGQGRGERVHRRGHAVRVGPAGPDPADLDAGVPRRHQAEAGHPQLPDAAPALPAGPVRGAAAGAGPVPRAVRTVLLRRAELLGGAQRAAATARPASRRTTRR